MIKIRLVLTSYPKKLVELVNPVKSCVVRQGSTLIEVKVAKTVRILVNNDFVVIYLWL
jgi:hypothetical protein